MHKVRTLGAVAACMATLATAVPAQAQHWRGGYHHYHHRHGGGGIDGGDLLLGAVIAGGAIALASSIDRGNRYEPEPPPPPPPPPPPGYGYDDGYRAVPDTGYREGYRDGYGDGYGDGYRTAPDIYGAPGY